MTRLLMLVLLLLARFGVALAASEPILDSGGLPPMRPGGLEAYKDRFLLGNLPRAWAIASNGAYGGEWGAGSLDVDRAAALRRCADKGGTDCAIYAEDLDVVWKGRTRLTRPDQPPLLSDRAYSFAPDSRFFWFGPQAARGVIVWGHGYGGPSSDGRGRQPPSFLRALNNAGFDVVRFDRDPGWDADIELVDGWLRTGLAELRRRGWRMIVAGGQSRGGWNALRLLLAPGAADAIVTASAAASGTNAGTLILRGETMMYSLLAAVQQQRTRVAYIQLRDDPFAGDEDKRVERMREMVGPKVGALLLIDRPDGFTGHSGAYDSAFGPRFGPCIMHFVVDPTPPAACGP